MDIISTLDGFLKVFKKLYGIMKNLSNLDQEFKNNQKVYAELELILQEIQEKVVRIEKIGNQLESKQSQSNSTISIIGDIRMGDNNSGKQIGVVSGDITFN